MVFMLVAYHAVMPFFGYLLSGLPGGILILAIIALWAYCAWAIYHLKADGWWITLIAFGAVLVSAVLTFARIDLMDMYRLMGYPEQQIEQMQKYNFLTGHNLMWLVPLWSLPFFGYLFFVKKYFRQPTQRTS